MTDVLDDTFVAVPALDNDKKDRKLGRWLAAFAIVAVLLGFSGALVSHAIFPPAAGKAGAVGAQGAVGQAGPSGPAGPAGSSTDLGTVGYCFNASYTSNSGASWVSGVSLYAPTNTNGTLSCPTGTFVPLQPSPSSTA